MNPRLAIVLAVLGVLSLAGIAIGLLGQRAGSSAEPDVPPLRFEGAVMPAGVRAPDFALTDQDGKPISMRALRGRPAIVTFLYTDCDETCPAQAQQIKGALDELGTDVTALAIAVNPPSDTAEKARRFLLEQRMTGRMDFVLGSREELEPVWKGFAIQPQEQALEHQARIVLIDSKGLQRVGFPADQATPERIAHDIRELAEEG